MRIVAAVIVSGFLLAGCLSDTPSSTTSTATPDASLGSAFPFVGRDANGLPVPSLLCRTALADAAASSAAPSLGRCNFDMTPDEGRQGNEVTIAVNPTDARNIVGGAKDYYPADAGECVWDGVYVTHDGFATATEDRSFDGSPWRLAAGDVGNYAPNYASTFWCTTDPVAYFDVNGRFYYLLMAYQTDPITGSTFCDEICPDGALNDWAFNRATQIVAVSDDGGDTFHTFTPVLEGSYPVSFHDKGWIAASADGTIHVLWLASLAPGNLYFRSTDEGKTFLDAELLASVAGTAGQGSFLDVGTGAQVYAMWTNGNAMHMRRSFDTGATWDADRAILSSNPAQHPGLSPRDRVTGFPALATDRSPASPFADAVYVVWHDACNDEAWSDGCSSEGSGIYVAASTDEGATFGAPVRVSSSEESWRVMPALSVSPGGVVDVSWMEMTDKAYPAGEGVGGPYGEHFGYTQMYSYSLDGAATWSEPMDIRDAGDGGWDPALSHHQNGMVFMGDYNDIDSSWQAAHPVWPDTRDGEHVKVYTATVQRPWFAEGWSDEDRIAADALAVAQTLG